MSDDQIWLAHTYNSPVTSHLKEHISTHGCTWRQHDGSSSAAWPNWPQLFFFFVTITTNLITQQNIDQYLCIFDLILFPSYLSRHLFVTQTAVTPCHSLETPQEVCPLDGEKKLTAPSSSLLVRLRVRQSLRKELWFNLIWAGVPQQCLPNKCPGAQSTQRDDDDFFFFSIFLYLNDSCKPRVLFAPTRTFVCVCVSFLTLCVKPQRWRRSNKHWLNGEKVFFSDAVSDTNGQLKWEETSSAKTLPFLFSTL